MVSPPISFPLNHFLSPARRFFLGDPVVDRQARSATFGF
jgi:hypothetical protein